MKKLKVIFVYFLDYLSREKGLDQNTINHHRFSLTKYINFLKENEIDSFSQVDEELINDYSAYLRKEGFSTGAIRKRLLVSVRVFHRFMASKGYTNDDITKTFRIDRRFPNYEKAKVRLFCKECINFRECEGKKWEECEYRGKLLKVV